MEFAKIIMIIFEVCIIPLLGILTKYLVSYLQKKAAEISAQTDSELAKKYIDMLTSTVSRCVIATNQTYVEALKQKGEFGLDAQIEAFNMTKEAVLAILGQEALNYLNSILDDADLYIDQLIEADVNIYKNN